VYSVGNLVSQLDDSAAKLKGKSPIKTYTYILKQLLYKVRHLRNVCELAFYLASIKENRRCIHVMSSLHLSFLRSSHSHSHTQMKLAPSANKHTEPDYDN
jgi:hypothetical protein